MLKVGKRFIYIYGIVLILLIFAYTMPGLFTHIDIGVRPAAGGDSMNVNLYFLNPVSNTLQRETRTITTPSSNTELIKAVLTELISGPAMSGLYRTIPRDITITEARFDEAGKLCAVDISQEYYNLPVRDQIFCKASLVWTLTEFDFINDVLIYVSQNRLANAQGQISDRLNRENLTLNPELSPVRINTRTITLYFAAGDNASLTPEARTIEVSGNIEYHIIDQLIKGPKGDGLTPTLLPDLKLKNANTTDGICYVDFGPEFLTRQLTGNEQDILIIQSVVYSLTELAGVQKVQIIADSATINASVSGIDLSMPVSRDDFISE